MSLNIETATIKDTIPSTLYTLFTNLQKVIRCQQFPFYVTHTPADTNLPGPLTEFSSATQLSVTLRPHGLQHARPPSLSITNFWSLLKLMSIKSGMPSNHLGNDRANAFLFPAF